MEPLMLMPETTFTFAFDTESDAQEWMVAIEAANHFLKRKLEEDSEEGKFANPADGAYLYKMCNGTGKWESRWVSLTQNILSYHHKKPGSAGDSGMPKMIPLDLGNAISKEMIVMGQKYAFEITMASRKYKFSCHSSPECKAWIAALEEVC